MTIMIVDIMRMAWWPVARSRITARRTTMLAAAPIPCHLRLGLQFIPQLGRSNTARAGLTGFVAGTSRQVASFGVTINNLLPGIHDTDRAMALDSGLVQARGITMDQVRADRAATIPARRCGTIQEFGAMCAFLFSQHAGFIVGQNILLDGGQAALTI